MEYKKILVPVAGTEADAEAIKLACRLAKKDKGKIWAVYVVAVKRALPLDAAIDSEIQKAGNILDNAERVAEGEDFQITTDVLQAREVGPAIINESQERGIDLILMGVKYKRHFGQFSVGNVVPYVLKNAPCPVILYQE